jgi:branched-chain amino acid transport system permease protein
VTPAARLQSRVERIIGVVILALLVLGPIGNTVFGSFWVNFILTQTLWLAIAAMSMIFLSAYGGMVSLCQVSMYGISALVLANVVTSGQTKGLHLGWSPWIGVVLAISITTAIGLAFGALAGRSFGIYFLMLTLTLAVLVNSSFGSVTLLSGFGGVGGIQDATPSLIGNPNLEPNRLYYVSLVVAIVVYGVMRYLVRTPFGMTLQGIRDDPVRMASLGYNVTLHRMLAFGFAAFVASLAGILFGWWNDTINPGTVNLSSVIALLVIAVIGSLFRLEGAWVGAFAYVYISNEVENHNWTIPWLGGTFNTMIGVIFLVIVCLSPGGLLGMWGSAFERLGRHTSMGSPRLAAAGTGGAEAVPPPVEGTER